METVSDGGAESADSASSMTEGLGGAELKSGGPISTPTPNPIRSMSIDAASIKYCNRIPTSPVQMRACHQISPPYAPPPPSFPTRPGSPILIGSSSERSPTEEGHAPLWTSEELTDRRTSFAQHPATTADLLDAI